MPDVDQQKVMVVRDLSRSFGSVRALDGLSFDVGPGEVIGLLGHNGAGKTTTIRILNGLLGLHGGEVRVFGLDPAVGGPEIRARTGVLTESPSIDERLTARENLTFAATMFGVHRSAVRGVVGDLLDRFGLGARADHRTSAFSRGMKQRLALARTLVHRPRALFLDEPTAALDPIAAREVHELIRQFAADEDRSVVVTTHNLVEAQQLCDRVVILRNGRSLAAGTPAEISRRVGRVGNVVVELGPGQGPSAVTALREGGQGSVEAAGDIVTIGGLTRDLVPMVVSTLVARGMDVYRVSPAEASLEDAYFALHEETRPR